MPDGFRIATWNVNSLRVRLPHVLDWLKTNSPDVLALQELKMPGEAFPETPFHELGYLPVVNGQKTWNGVALLARETGTDIINILPGAPEDLQRRLLAATFQGIRILNLYVPNGAGVDSEKFQYKLQWLSRLEQFIKAQQDQYARVVILGDFNIAPAPEDVYDAAACEGKVLFSQPERAAFQRLLACGFQDCFRLHPQAEKSFSWWDYRVNAFRRNLGFRIDHILASHALAKDCISCTIDKTPRARERPSDHTPVVAVFLCQNAQ